LGGDASAEGFVAGELPLWPTPILISWFLCAQGASGNTGSTWLRPFDLDVFSILGGRVVASFASTARQSNDYSVVLLGHSLDSYANTFLYGAPPWNRSFQALELCWAAQTTGRLPC